MVLGLKKMYRLYEAYGVWELRFVLSSEVQGLGPTRASRALAKKVALTHLNPESLNFGLGFRV